MSVQPSSLIFINGRTNLDASSSRIFTQREQYKLPEAWLNDAIQHFAEHFQLVIACSVPYNLMLSAETKLTVKKKVILTF